MVMARIFALVGNYEAAVKELEGVLSVPSQYSAVSVQADPNLTALQDYPGFQALLRKYTPAN